MQHALLISESMVTNGSANSQSGASNYSTAVTPADWSGNGDAQSYSAGDASADPTDLDNTYALGIHLEPVAFAGHHNPQDHAYFSGGPDNAVATLTQTVYFDHHALDLGFEVAGHFGGYGGQDDSMTLTAQFFDLDGHGVPHDFGAPVVIGGFDDANRGGLTALFFDSALGAIPEGAADGVRLTLTATRAPGGGTYNDGYADEISFALTGTNLTDAYVDVIANTDFSKQIVPATVGVWFNEGGGASATFSSSQFGAGGISLDGFIQGQGAGGDVMHINLTANANFDMSPMGFDYTWAGLVNFRGNAAGDTVTTCSASWSYSGTRAGVDIVNISALNPGAHYVFSGNDGDDLVQTALLNGGTLNGGNGNDSLSLHTNPVTGGSFDLTGVSNFEHIGLFDEDSFALTEVDANVAKNKTLVVDGSGLSGAHGLTFDASAEKDGTLIVFGSASVDFLRGGAHANNFTGNGSSDTMIGGKGDDTFFYHAVADSTGVGHDLVTGFDASHDHIDISQAPNAFVGMDAQNKHCNISTGNFDHDIGVAANAAHLHADHAIILTPNAGLYRDSFLVIDLNHVAGYQSGQDIVIELVNYNGRGFTAANIIAGSHARPLTEASNMPFEHVVAGLSGHHAGSFDGDILGMLC